MKLTEFLRRMELKRDEVKVITIDRLNYLEENISLLSNLMPDIEGKIYLVIENGETVEGTVVEADVNLDKSIEMKRVGELNKEVADLKRALLLGA